MFKVYPKAEESWLGFLVRCHKIGIKCLMCPRCTTVYDREMAEAFERVPFVPCWGHQGGRNMQRRPDSPYPRGAKRVSFKLHAEVPTDRWLQAKSDKGKWKWRSFDQGGRIAMAYRKQFNTAKREEIRLENYKGKNSMSRSQWRRNRGIKKLRGNRSQWK